MTDTEQIFGPCTVHQRPNDWHACITGQPGKWGCGRTIVEALRSVMLSWPEDVENTDKRTGS